MERHTLYIVTIGKRPYEVSSTWSRQEEMRETFQPYCSCGWTGYSTPDVYSKHNSTDPASGKMHWSWFPACKSMWFSDHISKFSGAMTIHIPAKRQALTVEEFYELLPQYKEKPNGS